jgi:hypothetical protein
MSPTSSPDELWQLVVASEGFDATPHHLRSRAKLSTILGQLLKPPQILSSGAAAAATEGCSCDPPTGTDAETVGRPWYPVWSAEAWTSRSTAAIAATEARRKALEVAAENARVAQVDAAVKRLSTAREKQLADARVKLREVDSSFAGFM